MPGVSVIARPRPAAKGSARKARRRTAVPAVLYGRGRPNVSVEIGTRDLRRILSTEAGENVVIDLSIEGQTAAVETVMVKQIQIHPVTHAPIHADLIRIDVTQTVRVKVPIILQGIAAGTAEGGILQHVLREIEVECLPTAIPSSIDLDITPLAIGKLIHVSEVALPPGVRVLDDPDSTVVTVTAPKAEEEAPAAAAGPAEPERIGEKKEGEEGAEGEAAPGAEKAEKGGEKAEKSEKSEKGEKK